MKFQIGDLVRVIGGDKDVIGEVGEVRDVRTNRRAGKETFTYGVRFDNNPEIRPALYLFPPNHLEAAVLDELAKVVS